MLLCRHVVTKAVQCRIAGTNNERQDLNISWIRTTANSGIERTTVSSVVNARLSVTGTRMGIIKALPHIPAIFKELEHVHASTFDQPLFAQPDAFCAHAGTGVFLAPASTFSP